ncbi:serine/threonine protein kinase [Shimia biformata]|uniref:serine/threonine protein kinase n=1 Tax=Shimia biformata TaxID=1294299 RepID=UPI001950A3E8|nr:serine/threonine-protein kinase [Shimia biformata]
MLDAEETSTALAAGTALLRGQYRIDRQIGQGGFGITYLAHDSLNRFVVIKECFPTDFCIRDGHEVVATEVGATRQFEALLEQFQAEAHQLAELDHRGIVGVHQVFAENGTAYMAMDFVSGDDLMTLVETDRARLTPALMDSILRQTLDAVGYLHDRGILHRDIAPDNLIVGAEGEVTLIDFGAAHSHGPAKPGQRQHLLAVKDGYSPPEFYDANAEQGAASDIYSLGALCHLLFTGEAPPYAEDRMEMVAAGLRDTYQPLVRRGLDLDPRLTLAVDRALALDPAHRFQCADEWTAMLDGPLVTPPAVERFDPRLVDVISDLVVETNGNMTPGVPKALMHTRTLPQTEQTAPQPPKQYVDIFGNPIDDVEAYLREQDRLCRERNRRLRRAQDSVAKEIGGYAETPPDSFSTTSDPGPNRANSAPATLFGRVLDRFKPSRRNSDTRLLQT